jgi:hypothetical protein
MNERIMKLFDQAIEEFKQEQKYATIIVPNPLKEKFAELIVRECADVLRVESERLYKLAAEEKDDLFARDFEACAEKCVDNEVAIKEHFGVEE